MSLYKRGDIWWYKFWFCGQLIRDTARTESKTLAREAEKARRHELELAVNRIPKRERMPLLKTAAKEWLATKSALTEQSIRRYQTCTANLNVEFGERLVCDILPKDIAAYQRKHIEAGKAPRSVNYEVGTLRGILKIYGLWGPMADRVKSLRERHDVGRAVTHDEEQELLSAIQRNRSLALLPLFVLSIDSGLRSSELKLLHREDLNLSEKNGIISAGEIVVPKSKTDAGTGRIIPLTSRTCAVLSLWLSRFSGAGPDSHVFPRHRVGIGGDQRNTYIYGVDIDRPIHSWKTAWKTACRDAGVSFRWHDLRHTFISRLAENPNVSEETIRSLAGHVSQKMLQRYSHIRVQAKRAAIEARN